VDKPVENKQTIFCLDYELLQGYLDSLGKDVVEKMFDLYCQQVDIYLQDISDAQLSDNDVAWQESCHKMKGATASVGMSYLHSQLKVYEFTTANQKEKAVILTALKEGNSQAITEFSNWLKAC
jgi:HPt (histidine-containing phosphotransfer) domain-containing protein